jgi:chromosome partitioning protein
LIITIASYKGGVGKTTSAIHLAAYLNTQAPTALFDGDNIRAATKWSHRGSGKGLPFDVHPIGSIGKKIGSYTHAVIDTEANPTDTDFKELVEGCDLLVIPAEPETTATDGLRHTLEELVKAGKEDGFRILITKVLPKPRDIEADKLRAALKASDYPVFKAQIPFLGAFHKASTEGTTAAAVKDDRNAKRAWKSYTDAGAEIMAAVKKTTAKEVAHG